MIIPKPSHAVRSSRSSKEGVLVPLRSIRLPHPACLSTEMGAGRGRMGICDAIRTITAQCVHPYGGACWRMLDKGVTWVTIGRMGSRAHEMHMYVKDMGCDCSVPVYCGEGKSL